MLSVVELCVEGGGGRPHRLLAPFLRASSASYLNLFPETLLLLTPTLTSLIYVAAATLSDPLPLSLTWPAAARRLWRESIPGLRHDVASRLVVRLKSYINRQMQGPSSPHPSTSLLFSTIIQDGPWSLYARPRRRSKRRVHRLYRRPCSLCQRCAARRNDRKDGSHSRAGRLGRKPEIPLRDVDPAVGI